MPFAVLGGLVLWSIWFQWHGHPFSWKCCIWSHQYRAFTQYGLIVFPLSIQIGLILQILFILILKYRYIHLVGYLGTHHVAMNHFINFWEFVQCCLIGLINSKLLSLLGNKFGSPLLQKYLPSTPPYPSKCEAWQPSHHDNKIWCCGDFFGHQLLPLHIRDKR